MCGRGGFSRGRGGGRGHGTGGRTSNNNSHTRTDNNYNTNRNNGKCPICQVCETEGHIVVQCWHHFDDSYSQEQRTVVVATTSYGIDTNWYTDTGATDHITGELEKLDVRNKYNGGDQVHTVSGSSMNISHIGHSVIPTPSHNLILKNIFHVPKAEKIAFRPSLHY
jgi:hypothetical protein